MHLYSRIIVQKRGEHKQEEESPVPTCVKEITGKEQQAILQFQVLLQDKPVYDENHW